MIELWSSKKSLWSLTWFTSHGECCSVCEELISLWAWWQQMESVSVGVHNGQTKCVLKSVNVFSLAVFGSYLRPDLVPANPSFYEGSSMGTISTSSIFVNVDNQTEERYRVSLSLSLIIASLSILMMQCYCTQYSHVDKKETLPHYCHLCSSIT